MKKFAIFLTIVVFTITVAATFLGCTLCRKGVYNISVKHSKREIYLSAYEAMCIKSCKPIITLKNSYRPLPEGDYFSNTFHVLLRKHKVFEPYSYQYFWRDPDKKTTKLKITP